MITLTKNNAKERCRTCLRKLIKNEQKLCLEEDDVVQDDDDGGNFVCISSNTELKDLLEKYVGIEGGEEANQDEDYPGNVCIECLKHLQSFEVFRNKALDSAEKLFRVFRDGGGTDLPKIELDDNGLESKDILQEQLNADKENDNDIFNLLLKDSLMETEAILLEGGGAESDNDINNMDPDPFQPEAGESKQRKCRRGKRKEAAAIQISSENHNKSKQIGKFNQPSTRATRRSKRSKECESNKGNSVEDKAVETKTETNTKEDDREQNVNKTEKEEHFEADDGNDWAEIDFHGMDDNDDSSTDNEVLSKKIQHSRNVTKRRKRSSKKSGSAEDVNDCDDDSDSDYVLGSLKIKTAPKDIIDADENNEYEIKNMDETKSEQESDGLSSESEFETKPTKKIKTSMGKRSAASGRKKGLTNSYKCEQCNRRFGHKITLDAHIRKVHEGEKRAYKCELCDKSYSFMGGLSTHMRETHERQEEAYKCQIPGCEKQYTSYITLQRHVRIKHLMTEVPTRFVCEQCGATFKQTSNLRYHMRTRHPTEEDLKHKEIIKERLECEICKKFFNSQYTLKYHKLRIHADDKKYECKICGRRVAKQFMLDQHMLVHSEDKTACKFCGREFVRKYQVEAHIKAVHQKLKPFQCPHCSESFASRKTLRHHIYIHTGEKPYVCDVCGQAYRQPTCLKNHRKIHNKTANSNSGNPLPESVDPDAAADAMTVNRNFLNNLIIQGKEDAMDEDDVLGLH